MKVLIMGCGRVGAELAAMLDQEGHEVTVLDRNPDAFRRLPPEFGGHRVVGNGIDQEVLARIGVAEMDAFVSVTQGDNRNVMAAQMAKHLFGVTRVVCRIYDPIRASTSWSIPLPTTRWPPNSGGRRRNASGLRSRTVTSCPSWSSIAASSAPTRPQPMISTFTARRSQPPSGR